MIRGSSLMLLLQLGERAVGLVSLGLLTRLLTPSDFGLVALATAVSGMLTSAIATNFSAGVISLQRAERSDYDTAWTLNAARGAMLALLVCSAALVARQTATPDRVSTILLALAVVPLLDGLRNVGLTAMQKQLRFEPTVWVGLSARLVGSGGAVLIAYLTSSYWALVVGPVLVAAAGLIGSFVASDYRPRLDLRRWRILWGFSGWLAGSNLLGSVANRADVFFVNHYLGLGVAGIYNMGNDIGQMFYGQVVLPLLASLFPGLSRLAHAREAHVRAFRRAREVLIGICLPIGVGIGLVAGGFVKVAFGPKFELAGPVIAMVSLSFTIQLVTIGMDETLQSIQRTRPIFVRQAISAVVRFGLMVAGITLGGLMGLLLGRVVGAVLLTVMNARLLTRELHVPTSELLLPHARPILATAMMAVGSLCWQLSPLRHALVWPALTLASDIAIGAAIFSAALLGMWHASKRPDGFEREAWNLLSSQLSRSAVR
jgi:O-antigen/teichoic acid export membrane protein